MAVIFLWQFPPLYFAIFSGNSNPGPLFLLFGFPESPNGNSHPCFLPFSPKIANLTPCFCYLASRPQSPATARPQQKPRRNGLEAAQAQPASGQPRADTKKRQPFRLSSFWSGKRGSDPRPQPWQGCALPTELFPRSVSRLGLQIYNDILNPQKNLQFFRKNYTSITALAPKEPQAGKRNCRPKKRTAGRKNYTSIEVLNSRRNLKSFSK